MTSAHDEVYTKVAVLEGMVNTLQADTERLRTELRALQDAKIQADTMVLLAAKRRGNVSWWLSVIVGAGAAATVIPKLFEMARVALSSPPKLP